MGCSPAGGGGVQVRASLSSPAVPSACPTRRFTTVANGQQRSAALVPELHQRPSTGSRSVLSSRYSSRWSVLGPHSVGNPWSSTGTSGQRR